MKLKTLIACLFTAWFYPAVAGAKTPESKVYWEEDNKGNIVFFADNQNAIPHWVDISLTNVKNMQPSQPGPFTFTIQPNTKKGVLFRLKPITKNGGYNFEVATLILPGKGPTTQHNNNHLYLLPFAHGKKYRVGQAYFGSATHLRPNPYAIDFNMDTGTTISAARSGIVADVKQDSNIGGPSPKYAKHGNHVTIYHDDGTFATYAHLKKRGALVSVGSRVQAGQSIGLSGNTGQTSGPHLHFEVFNYNPQGQSRNLPVKFLNHDNKALSDLKEGLYYYATHPRRKKFPVELGSALKNSDFNKATTKLRYSDKFDITSENIDDSVVLYASNGKKSVVDIELDLNLFNYQPSKSSPLSASIPPLSKQFLLILKPIDHSKPGKYGYSFKQQVISPEIDDNQYNRHKKRVRQTDNIDIRQKQIDDKVLLYASNGFNTTKNLTITLKLTNMAPSKRQKMTIKIPPLTEVYLQHVKLIDSTKDANLGFSYGWD